MANILMFTAGNGIESRPPFYFVRPDKDSWTKGKRKGNEYLNGNLFLCV